MTPTTIKPKSSRGLRFALVGHIPNVNKVRSMLRDKFGVAHTSTVITAKTDLVIAGDNCGRKLDRAKQLGIYVVSLKTFTQPRHT
jgi:NAD-dependent DNA ligase